MIDPAKVAFFIPPELKTFKLNLFNRIGARIVAAGGRIVRGDHEALRGLPAEVIPVVGCSPQLTPMLAEWRAARRTFIYWDRGYWQRVFATWLPRGTDGGLYRWHVNSYQQQAIRAVPADRLAHRPPPVQPWAKAGRHIVIAQPTATYARFHGIEGWTDRTLDALSRLTDRQLVIRGKETRRPLQADLEGAHALVTHGSNAAVEAAILGCPVFVHPDSAAALVGRTDLSRIEAPTYPDREAWLRSLAYSQFDETELVDGALWRLLE